jgi:hypothetical protein
LLGPVLSSGPVVAANDWKLSLGWIAQIRQCENRIFDPGQARF